LLTFPTITYHLATVTITSSLEVAFDDVLVFTPTNSTRAMIYDFIKDNPGVQFRGICNELGLAIGLAEFHLGVLKKAGLISFIRDGRYKRFFEAKRFSLKEMQLISLLRHKTVSNILRSILTTKTMSHSELAYQLSITSQGLTWQMNQLKKAGVVQQSSEGIKAFYTLEETCAPILTEIMSLVEKP
jgi:predicted transcriptional regulator